MTAIAEHETAAPAVQAAPASPLDEMRDFIGQFIDASGAQLDAITLWVGHTHVLGAFVATPRLLFTSRDPGCGKSEALRRVRDLSANGWSASRATKYAVTAKLDCPPEAKPTIIVDEVSQIFGKSGRSGATHPLAGLLLNGYKFGETESFSANRTTVDVDIFTAAALGGRGNAVPDDVRDRAIAIMMQPGRPAMDYLVREHDPMAAMYRAAVGQFLRQHLAELETFRARGIHPKLTGRRREIWEPLFAVAQVAGGTWPQRCLEAFLDLAMDQAAAQILTPQQAAIRDVLRAAQAIGGAEIPGRAVIDRIRGFGEPLYEGMPDRSLEMFIAKAMEPYQPVQLSRTENEGRQPRGYYLADIERLAAERLPADPEPDADEDESDAEDESIF